MTKNTPNFTESNVYPTPYINFEKISTPIHIEFNASADNHHQSDPKTPQNIRHKKART